MVAGVVLFRDIVADSRDLVAKVNLLRDFEHAGDLLTHNTLDKLNCSFITPFDREDIHVLITHLDDILDPVDAAGQRLVLYRITEMPETLVPLGEILVASAK